jgi:hypothetical protein
VKTRNGFVSNSSSSSFVLALPRLPKSAEELHGWMFPSGPCIVSPYGDPASSERIAEAAFNDLSAESKLTRDQMAEQFTRGTVYCDIAEIDWPKYPHWRNNQTWEERKPLYDQYDADRKVAARKLADAMICQNPKAEFHVVEYSDNDGPFWTVMEHGDVFEHLPHQRISHH